MLRSVITLTTLLLAVMCTGQKPEKTTKEFTDEEFEKHHEMKSKGLEHVLGKSDSIVGHAIIPFEIGGAVDMYYYPNGIKGTGFATMELIQPDGTGPVPNRNGTYELVAFTKLPYASDTSETHPFNLIERRTCGIFTAIGSYSFEAKLEPGETMEIPEEDSSTKCIVFDEYKPDNKKFLIGDKRHGLLLVIEIFRDEMEYAMENGSQELLKKLKAKGYYPYSDLDRPSVVK
jgi:hypothetical protein